MCNDCGPSNADMEHDGEYEFAKGVIVAFGSYSVSVLQRRLLIGYARARRLLDRMEAENVLTNPNPACAAETGDGR